MRIRARRGFTLLEMLLAVAIFGMIAAATTGLLRQSLEARSIGASRSAALAELQVGRALISADMAQLSLRSPRGVYGEIGQPAFMGFDEGIRDDDGDRLLMTFVRAGRDNPGALEPRGILQRVSYVLRDDSLIRKAWARVDPTPDTRVYERVLLSGIRDLEVAFIARGQPQSRWLGGPNNPLPGAVRLKFSSEAYDQIALSFLAGVGR